jgi:hypothetical protein
VVAAEYVTAVVAEHEEPSSMILPQTKANNNILEQGRLLTWTDDFFEQQPGRHNDVVAVFDYDLDILKKVVVAEKFASAQYCATMVFMGAIWWCLLTDGPFLVIVLCGSLLLMAMYAWIRRAEEAMAVVVSWKHTALTQTGLRHVHTRPTPLHHSAFTLDIPFEDILSIKRTTTPNTRGVLLTLASTSGDGVEYITSGDCSLPKSAAPSQVNLVLTSLREPVLFMKVLQDMKDKSQLAPGKSSSSSKAAELLRRVESFLDNCSERLLDRNVEQSLRELVVEMRELNNNNNNNTSSSIEQRDVATIV